MDVACFYQVPEGCEVEEISAVGTRVLKLEHGRAVDFSACRRGLRGMGCNKAARAVNGGTVLEVAFGSCF